MPEHAPPTAARRQPTDFNPSILWIGPPLVVACIVALALLVLWLYPPGRTAHTLQPPLPLYPQPRLQPNPAADMARFRRAQLQRLDTTGWVDRDHGIVHIPIDTAMGEIAHRGIPGWPASWPDTAPPAAVPAPGATP